MNANSWAWPIFFVNAQADRSTILRHEFLAARADELNRADLLSRVAMREKKHVVGESFHDASRSPLVSPYSRNNGHVTVAKSKQEWRTTKYTTKDSRTFPNYHNNDRVPFHSGPSRKIVGVLLFRGDSGCTKIHGKWRSTRLWWSYRTTTPSSKNQWKYFLSIVGTM